MVVAARKVSHLIDAAVYNIDQPGLDEYIAEGYVVKYIGAGREFHSAIEATEYASQFTPTGTTIEFGSRDATAASWFTDDGIAHISLGPTTHSQFYLLHEVAHVLLPGLEGHGQRWRATYDKLLSREMPEHLAELRWQRKDLKANPLTSEQMRSLESSMQGQSRTKDRALRRQGIR